MSGRRCVICGEEPPAKDAKGNEAYAYPKTAEEARIWQASMAAKNCCLESIQNQCCVSGQEDWPAVKTLEREKEKRMDERAAAEAAMGCQCPDDGQPGPERPTVNVLLLNGASLPTYCGKAAEGDSEVKLTKWLNPKDSDTEIFVQESEFKDTGGTFPDIDGTEVTMLRAPMQEEEKLEHLQQEQQEADQEQDPSVRRRRNSCLPGCTDVLLLGRGHHPTDECPCQCEQCTRPSGLPEDEPCCQPECCPEPEPIYHTQPPCGCECEQQVRRELTKVIKTQGRRIHELEEILCRQNNLRNCLQRKLDELYCEFGRLDEDEASRSRLTCRGSERGGPDCVAVLNPAPPPPPPPPQPRSDPPSRRSLISRRLTLMKANQVEEEPATEEQRASLPMPGQRVHCFAEKRAHSVQATHRPRWVQVADKDKTDSDSKIAIRFGNNSTYLVPSGNESFYTLGPRSQNSHSNSTYSLSNRSRT
ncbi:hypothetical protein M5D96_005590 [Drosophila gunungcola]|uniref:Uncharacterized protein n=1 Tax=Drosophila gunungcola TaxID=103775 RepID=A0A9P9YRA8_9MUSC|nr:hypothetical protein M5D96_005590 [Drosophila gunungcola]